MVLILIGMARKSGKKKTDEKKPAVIPALKADVGKWVSVRHDVGA